MNFKVGDKVIPVDINNAGNWKTNCRAAGLDPRTPKVVTAIDYDGDPIIGSINEWRWPPKFFRLAGYQTQQEIDTAIEELINS